MNTNQPIMACLRVADARQVVSGSVERECPDCGQAVYVSPASMQIINAGARLVCSHCVRAEHVTSIEMSRAQARELAAYLRRN